METDIILEGFCDAEKTHGVRYISFIGDGDSSVYSTLVQNVPGWGRDIQKMECANHACKCYRGALEKVVQDNPSYKGAGALTKTMRQKLVSGARSAIKMRSKESDRVKAIKRDLLNGPLHYFGQHSNCSPDYCTTKRQQQQHLPSLPNSGTSAGGSSGYGSSAGGSSAGVVAPNDEDEDTTVLGNVVYLIT